MDPLAVKGFKTVLDKDKLWDLELPNRQDTNDIFFKL